jgi:acetyl-CoA carboxylase carboxyl transferase subunit alpha
MRPRQRARRRLIPVQPEVTETAVANEPELTPAQTGMLSALDFWMCAAEAMYFAANRRNDPNMEAVSKAQEELTRIETQLQQLQSAAGENQEARKQLQALHDRVESLRRQMAGQLTPWERTELARHPNRPYPLDYIERLFPDFSEIHGDRAFGDDAAMVCGMARFRGREVLVLGTQKGRDTKQRVHRNFGQPNPEGYRKALRAMKFAEKWRRPVISLIDVVGAYPGLGAEERGQAEAIAHNLREMARLAVPFIAIITGEGGSGGALAIAVADRVLMLENSIYSVISPEGCASIMWHDSSKKDVAAAALRITAKDNLEMGICDEVIPEPPGGAHHDHDAAADALAEVLEKQLSELEKMATVARLDARYKKFRTMAQYFDVQAAPA